MGERVSCAPPKLRCRSLKPLDMKLTMELSMEKSVVETDWIDGASPKASPNKNGQVVVDDLM